MIYLGGRSISIDSSERERVRKTRIFLINAKERLGELRIKEPGKKGEGVRGRLYLLFKRRKCDGGVLIRLKQRHLGMSEKCYKKRKMPFSGHGAKPL